MIDDLAHSVPLPDASAVGEARRLARTLAGRLGFESTDVERVAIGVTEAATNVVKHAGKGDLVLAPVVHEGAPALAVLALDRGPGVPDLERCMRDGYSTGGTPGTGLGAIRRQSEALEVYAPRGNGTALYALFRARRAAPPKPDPLPVTIGALRLPYPGEVVCGDLWALERTGSGFALMVADGLGHGLQAADASQAAAKLFAKHADLDPAAALEFANAGMRHTRGAAVSLARVETATRQLRYAGVGNVSGLLLSGFGHQGLLGFSGIVGQDAVRKVASNGYTWPAESVLVLFSDGLGSRWRPDEYPGLLACHPLLVAGVLVRDHRRARDDVTVVVVRWAAR